MNLHEEEKFRVVFTGGGSGGHIYPLLAVADALRKRLLALNAPAEFIYMGPQDGWSELLKTRGFTMKYVSAGKVRRYGSLSNIFAGPKFLMGLIQSLFTLYAIMPDVIFSKGGTGALPVVIAGWFYRIPVAIHESDAQPGLTNLASARFAKKVYVSFPRAMKFFDERKAELSGPPLRAELTENHIAKELAKETLGFDPKEPLTVVLGGSQGSVRVNEFVLTNLKTFTGMTQVFHQTGVANFLEAQKLSRAALMDTAAKNRYQPVNYVENMEVVLSAADVVVSRSGSSILEIAAYGIPAVLIPLAGSANDHQRVNAYELSNAGAAIVIEEPNLLPGIFFTQLQSLFSRPDIYEKMSAAAKAFFIPGGAEKIAEGILTVGVPAP